MQEQHLAPLCSCSEDPENSAIDFVTTVDLVGTGERVECDTPITVLRLIRVLRKQNILQVVARKECG